MEQFVNENQDSKETIEYDNLPADIKRKFLLLSIRTKAEEIMELVLFFGGIALTVLSAFGILSFGALGLGIFAAFTFIGASRFFSTNSWSRQHNELTSEYCPNASKYYPYHQSSSLNSKIDYPIAEMFKTRIIPLISLIIGIAVIAFVPNIILSFGIGIPILSASIIGLINGFYRRYCAYKNSHDVSDGINIDVYTKIDTQYSDNYYGVCTMVCGFASSIVFGTLFLSGVLALPTALGLGAPIFFVALFNAFVFCFTRYKNEKIFKSISTEDRRSSEYRILGMCWSPEEPKFNKMIERENEIVDESPQQL